MSGGSSSTTSNNIPAWVSNAGQTNYADATSLYNAPTVAPPTADQRVAAFTPDQTNAFSMLNNYINSGGGTSGAAVNQGIADISDPGANLNPYVDATLTPTIRNINQAATAANMSLGDSAASAGAFGDARQGVLEGQVNQNQQQAISDATANAYSNAYNSSIAQGSNLVNAGTTGQSNFMTQLQALLGIGSTQQQNAQSADDVNYQNYQTTQQQPYDKLNALIGALSGTPYSTSSTTTTDNGSSGVFGALGSVLGALI